MAYKTVMETCPKCQGKGVVPCNVLDPENTLSLSFDVVELVEGGSKNEKNLANHNDD